MNYSLYPYQQTHFDRLVDIFSKHKVAIDCSKTGSGKTIIALKLAEYFLTRRNFDEIIIVCPPTLVEQWEKYIQPKDPSIVIFSSYSLHKIKLDKQKKYFLVVDECHLFKNNVQRTQKLKKIVQHIHHALMISATPFDDNRQTINVQSIFEIDRNQELKDHISSMDFEYEHSVNYALYHIPQDESNRVLYEKGYKSVLNSTKRRSGAGEAQEGLFNAKMFSSGIQKIHDSLVNYLIEYVKNSRKNEPNCKIVVVMNYTRHFDLFKEEFENVLVLNGETKMTERKEMIAKFQQNDLEYPIICISAEVGSVGIELDDKTGEYPRHMILLPTTNGISFCQSIGRIQRTHTKSNSRVSIIQPTKLNTYFKAQTERKFKVLEQFMSVPEFETQIEKHDENCSGDAECKCLK